MLATSSPMSAPSERAQLPTSTRWGLDALDEKLANASVKKIRSREHLFLEGDLKTHVYKVEVGTVLIYKILPDAKRQIIDIAFPGDLIGLGPVREQPFSAQATEPSRVRCIPVGALEQLASENPRLGFELYEAVALELEATRSHLMTIGYRSAAGRLANFLLALSHRHERRGRVASEFVLHMRRADIADFLGVTIETVSRTFSKLKAQSLIDLDHGGYVAILDREGLKDIAEGEDHWA